MSEAEIDTFRLRVLGGYALDGTSGAAAPVFPKRRAEAVLAVLAVSGDLGCTRERLLALLWPESEEASARHGLREALHVIRRTLGEDWRRSAGGPIQGVASEHAEPEGVDLCLRHRD